MANRNTKIRASQMLPFNIVDDTIEVLKIDSSLNTLLGARA